MLLFIRTDSGEAEVGLIKDFVISQHIKWQAGRNLSQDIHKKIKDALDKAGMSWLDLTGIIFYEGPGSFTGLRIGAAVANALASELNITISQASGEDWINLGAQKLKNHPNNRFIVPSYGREPHITKPRK
jgi:tRNA threonylcarbamoyladenosine biosynthesis protein TsaB